MGKMATAHNEYRSKYRMRSKIVEHSLQGRSQHPKTREVLQRWGLRVALAVNPTRYQPASPSSFRWR
jgi:hypothetical protein